MNSLGAFPIFVTVYGIGVGRVDKGAGFCVVSTNDYRMNGRFAPLNPPLQGYGKKDQMT